MSREPEQFDIPEESPPRKRMSSGTKVLLILLGIFGGLFLLCCGGGVYFIFKFKQSIEYTDNPEAVRQTTQEITTISIPARFRPAFFIKIEFPDFFFMKGSQLPKIRMVVYLPENSAGSLMLTEVIGPEGQKGEFGPAEREQIRQQLEQQKQGGQIARKLTRLENLKTHTVNIRGEQVTFRFQKGIDSENEKPYRQITATLPGQKKGSVVLFQLQLPEEDYREDEVLQLIESIR